MDTLGTSHFVLYREVVLSSEVKIIILQYNREETSKCVHYRVVFSIVSIIESVLYYQRFYCFSVLTVSGSAPLDSSKSTISISLLAPAIRAGDSPT